MTGLEFLAWTRGARRLNRLPLIMLSSSDAPRDIARSKEPGFDHYYVKFPSTTEVAKLLKAAGLPPSASS
jgi:CheY-like chemotaxis protein